MIENKRLFSLDAFRGFTVASMVVVNNPGSSEHIFLPLRHAFWHGWNFADFIFPFFLWIVGVAIAISFSVHSITSYQLLKHVFCRSISLFFIGLFLNGFPFGLILGHDFSWATIRIPGVLQRIAVCYFVASLVAIYCKIAWQIGITIFLVASYWLCLKIIVVPGFGAGLLEPIGNLAWYIDANLLHDHTWINAPVTGFDPEGIFSTISAITTVLFGILTGHLLKFSKEPKQKTILMLILGAIFILIGLGISNWLPINKNLWTPSYAVFTSGVALLIFACFYWIMDVKNCQKWFKPLQIYGLNALSIFVISGIVGRLLNFIKITQLPKMPCSLHSYYYKFLFSSITNPNLASFLHAIVFMLMMYLIAYGFYAFSAKKNKLRMHVGTLKIK